MSQHLSALLVPFVARAELAANGVVHCLPGELPKIYRGDGECKRKDHLVTVHTSANVVDV